MSTRQKTELLLESWSNAARVLTLAGVASNGSKFNFNHTTAADKSKVGQKFTLDSDQPLFVKTLNVLPPADVQRGECYVRVSLLWGGVSIQRISSGYVTDAKSIAYPPGVFEGFRDGQGLMRSLAVADPAAGAQFIQTVPDNTVWLLHTALAQLITDVNVADRGVMLIIDDGTAILTQVTDVAAQAASLNFNYFWSLHGESRAGVVNTNRINARLPLVYLEPGWRIRSITTNMQAGDDFAAPRLQVEEWIVA